MKLIILLLLSSSAFADEKVVIGPFTETISYLAKNNGDDKFCAKIQEDRFGRIFNRTRCRTIEEWKLSGYIVTKEK